MPEKTAKLSANIPLDTMRAIEEFQRRHNHMFRSDAIIQMVEVACQAVGIDLDNLQQTETKPQEQEKALPEKINCPFTHTLGTYWRCEKCAKKEPSRFKECNTIPSEWLKDIREEEPEEEIKAKPQQEEVKEVARKPQLAPQKEQPSVNTVTTKTEPKKWICLKNKPKNPDPVMQEQLCNTCKASDWSMWKACQELKREELKP